MSTFGTFGTFGYVKNNERKVFIIRSIYQDETLETMYELYIYITKFGAPRFIKEMNKNPDGFQSVKFNWGNGNLYGDAWEGDHVTELSSDKSPYSNLWYDADKRKIYGEYMGGEFELKIPNIYYCTKTRKNKKSIFEALFNEDVHFMKWIKMFNGPRFLKNCACNFYLLTKDQQ